MVVELTDGSYFVAGYKCGHVCVEVRDVNGVVRFVCSMTMEEASSLASDLGIIVDSIVEERALREASK